MKSSVETLSPTRVKLTVEIPFDELSDNLATAYKRIGAQVTVPGFRKGKVPTRVIDQRFGRGAVIEEAVNDALPKAYDDAVKEHSVVALGQPAIDVTDVTDGESLTFTAEVDIRPEFDLPEYEGLAVSVDDAVVTEEAIDEQLDALRKRFGTAIPVEREAQDDDLVLIDVDGMLNGQKLEEYSAQALSYEVGSQGMVNGADEAIRGLSEGESATFEFTPDGGDFANDPISITVTVQGVRERSLPEADDEFAQLASEFDTLADLRDDLRGKVERLQLVEQGMDAREKVLEILIAGVDIPIPQSLLDAQLGEHFEDGHGDDDHHGEVENDTKKSIRTQFILDRIADAQAMIVGQAELTQWLMSQAPRYGMTVDQLVESLVEANQVQMAVADVRRGKALAYVLQKATVTDASGNEVNLTALDEPDRNDIQAQIQAAMAAAEAEMDEEELEEVEEIIEELSELEALENELVAEPDVPEPAPDEPKA